VPDLRALLPDLGRRTLVMGVLNVTPDSFSDGGRYDDPVRAVDRARAMRDEGADLIDVGGESTRPGARPVSADEEMRRVLPVIERLASTPFVPISLDTTKSVVARAGAQAGATLINDVSAGTLDADMLPVVAAAGLPVCLMHLPVRPQEMGWSSAAASFTNDDGEDDAFLASVAAFLSARAKAARAAGISETNIVLDPGFGFGKSAAQNLLLLRRLGDLRARIGGPFAWLVGTSRKSTLARVLGPEADARDPERLAGTAATVAFAVAGGAHIVRVHEVGFLARVARMSDAVCRA